MYVLVELLFVYACYTFAYMYAVFYFIYKEMLDTEASSHVKDVVRLHTYM